MAKTLRFKLHFIALLLLLLGSPSAFSDNKCADIFFKTSAQFQNTPEFRQILEASQSTLDTDFSTIHLNLMKISRDPALQERIPDLERALTLALHKYRPSSLEDVKIKNVLFVLPLLRGEVADWVRILTVDVEVMESLGNYGISGTLGHMLRHLDRMTQSQILRELGKVYAVKKNRVAVKAAHIILDPLARYREFKRQGRSDREFYEAYLTEIQDRMFIDFKVNPGLWNRILGRHHVSDYGIDVPLRIAEIIRETMFPQHQHGIEFFGSVPNGFGKLDSDLDIFNHPIASKIPQGFLNVEGLDINSFRRPIDSPELNKAIANYLEPLNWKWQIENRRVMLPTAFMGGRTNLFVFFITAQEIQLLFFPYQLKIHEDGSNDVKHFTPIRLDLKN